MNWKEKYNVVSEIQGGAQGNCFVVSEINTGKEYFLKELKPELENVERRQRFIVETTIFKSLNDYNIQGIPKIIDCNTNVVQNNEYTLYYCAELIIGKNLKDTIDKENVSEEQIKTIFTGILQLLSSCHSKDVVHRDVKPDNIIFDNNNNLYLVDFGISCIKGQNEGLTVTGQEIGNRFLRLPEFSAGSSSKRDIRSDLTLACAIALYMITKTYPRVMSNYSGQFPHQTPESKDAIGKLEYCEYWNYIFDKAFQCDLSKRWSSTIEIMEVIDMMKKNNKNYERNLERIRFDSKRLPENLKKLQINLNSIYELLEQIASSFIKKEAQSFRIGPERTVCNLGDTQAEGEIRIYHILKNTKEPIGTIYFSVELIGEQIVGYMKSLDTKSELIRISSSDTIAAINIDYLEKNMHEKIADILASLLDIQV